MAIDLVDFSNASGISVLEITIVGGMNTKLHYGEYVMVIENPLNLK